MNLILTGHERSGTSLLARILQSHPEINLTFEFANFKFLGWPVPAHTLFTLFRAWERRSQKIKGGIEPQYRFLRNLMFVFRYNSSLLRRKGLGIVDFDSAASALREILPQAKVTGDKYPDYIFRLDCLPTSNATRTIAIFRDPRPVCRTNRTRRRSSSP